MTRFFQSLAALPLREAGRRPDVVLALGVAFIVAMLIIPLPTVLLDGLLAVNISAAVLILIVALFARRALDLSSFPTLLLVTTLFRLGLNVSTTRGILARGDGGEVVAAFGRFVLQGDVVVGTAIFLVITLVQFIVIAKGSERVAEVAARFTLDAMPGKQMAIDAALRAGALEEAEAERRRGELSRESQLFGNMDGAMKFVKGDAVAALIITALNFVAGLLIGVVRHGLSLEFALDTYSVLAVGDALVSQIPALLITLAAGLLVTRVQGRSKEENLGHTVREELFSSPRALAIAGALMLGLALVPGLPGLPFGLLGVLCFGGAASRRVFPDERPAPAAAREGELKARLEQAKAQKASTDQLAPSVIPVGIDLDPVLSRALGFVEGAGTPPLVATLIPQLRDALYLETGVRFPGVRVRTDVEGLPASSFVVRVNDVPALHEVFPADHHLAVAPPSALTRLGLRARGLVHPVNGAELSVVSTQEKAVVEAAGVRTWDVAGYVVIAMAGVLKRRARAFLGFQEVSEMVDRLEKAYPALVKETIPKIVSVPQLVEVLRRLVEEGVSVRDLKSIVQALGEHGRFDEDVLYLTEKARGALGHQLAYAHAGLGGRLTVLLLDPLIEETIQGAIVEAKGGRLLSLDPVVCRDIIDTVSAALRPMLEAGARPAVLTHGEIRRYVRRMLEADLPETAVLSYDELPPDLVIQPMGRASLACAA